MNAREVIALVEVRSELGYLARHLRLTPEDRAEEAAYHLHHLLPGWLEQRETTGDRYTLWSDIYGPDPASGTDSLDQLDELRQHDPAAFAEFGQHALQQLYTGRHTCGGEPPWVYLEFKGYVHDAWLVHFSDAADDIFHAGFAYGVSPEEPERLGLSTNWRDDVRRSTPGFNFAYTVADAKRALRGGGRNPYGRHAVVFRADGLLVWHNSDEERQVIFLGSTAHDVTQLYQLDGRWAVGERPGGQPTYAGSFADVVDWVVANRHQYRRVLRPPRERPTH